MATALKINTRPIPPIKCTREELEDDTNGVCLSCGKILHNGFCRGAQGWTCKFCLQPTAYNLADIYESGKLVMDLRQPPDESEVSG